MSDTIGGRVGRHGEIGEAGQRVEPDRIGTTPTWVLPPSSHTNGTELP
jgi:hypothetical protein